MTKPEADAILAEIAERHRGRIRATLLERHVVNAANDEVSYRLIVTCIPIARTVSIYNRVQWEGLIDAWQWFFAGADDRLPVAPLPPDEDDELLVDMPVWWDQADRRSAGGILKTPAIVTKLPRPGGGLVGIVYQSGEAWKVRYVARTRLSRRVLEEKNTKNRKERSI
jgi:hypothetical protein